MSIERTIQGSRIESWCLLALGALVLVAGCDEKSGDESATSKSPESAKTEKAEEQQEAPPEPRSLEVPAAEGAMAPSVFETEAGVGLSWLESSAGAGGDAGENPSYAFKFAEWDGTEWTAPVAVTEGGELFANWADVPSVRKLGEGRYLAQWLRKLEGPPHAYAIDLARSSDGGNTWTKLGSPHEDGTATEHGFVSMAPVEGGTLAVWLDGRERADDEEGPMTLRGRVIADASGDSDGDGGGAFAGSTTVLDERVCECCPTDAARAGESVLIAYRNRTEEEIRDIWTVRRVGDEWAEPQPLSEEGWEIDGCPVNGPAVAADGSTVAVAWYTEAGGASRVRLAISDDGGKDFGKPVRVDSGDGNGPAGRVDVAFVDGDAVVSWLAPAGEGDDSGAVKIRRVGADGKRGGAVTVGTTSTQRSSGIPRVASAESGLAVFWRSTGDSPSLKGALYPAEAIPETGESASEASSDGEQAGAKRGGTIPTLQATKLAGGTSKISATEGPTLVNLWATWCAPCRAEMPLLRKVRKKWASKEVTMIGLSVEGKKSRDKLEKYADNNEMPFDVWFAPKSDPLAQFGANAVPATFLYDASGSLVWSHDGKLEKKELAALNDQIGRLIGN